MPIESRSPPPSREELVARSRALLPLIARNAVESDIEREIADENVQAIEDAGLFKLPTPRRYGGFASDLQTMIEVTAALGEACGATAWVVANRYVCSWVASLLPSRAQDEIFGDDPAIGIAGVNAPSAQARRVIGGVRATGKWYYCSGSSRARWAMLGMLETDGDGNVVDQYLAMVPIQEISIEDTWYTVGMRGTASNCMVANDVFIPDHRLFSLFSALQGVYPREQSPEALYRSTFAAFFPMNLTGPLLGLGRAALRHVIETAPDRGITGTIYKKQTESSVFQVRIAEAAMKIDAAELLVARAAQDVDAAASRGEMMDLPARTRTRAAASYAGTLITDAIDMLMSAHGAGSFAATNPLQRIWRDANIATRHTALLYPVAMEVHGRALLGVEENIALLV
ncbi:MAG: acyl-CoA dehydrogenase family protein [Burkholderiales bacterium]